MFDSIGAPELLIILAIIVLVLGVGRISEVGKELGSAISAFRKELNDGSQKKTTTETSTAPHDPPLDAPKAP